MICVTKLLNEKIVITSFDEHGNEQQVKVGVSYSSNLTDERYFQDIFLQHTMNDLVDNKIAEGSYGNLPRMIIRFTDGNILLSELTNRFVLGTEIQRSADGKQKKVKSRLNRLPMEVNCSIAVHCDTYLNLLKLVESFIKTFYKVTKSTFIHRNQLHDVYVVIPENTTLPEVSTFSFGQMEQHKFEFEISLAIKTYMYVFADKKYGKAERMNEIDTTFHLNDDSELLVTDINDIPT